MPRARRLLRLHLGSLAFTAILVAALGLFAADRITAAHVGTRPWIVPGASYESLESAYRSPPPRPTPPDVAAWRAQRIAHASPALRRALDRPVGYVLFHEISVHEALALVSRLSGVRIDVEPHDVERSIVCIDAFRPTATLEQAIETILFSNHARTTHLHARAEGDHLVVFRTPDTTQRAWPRLPTLLLPGSVADRWLDSPEWAAADADAIVRARIVARHDEAAIPGNVIAWRTVDLDIIETIKGELPPRFTRSFTVAEWHDVRCTPTPVDDEAERLIFLDRRARFGDGPTLPGQCDWVIRKHGGPYATHNPSVIIPLVNGVPTTQDSDPNPQRAPGPLLDRVRRAARWAAQNAPVRAHVIGQGAQPFEARWCGPTGEYGIKIPIGEPFFQEARDRLRDIWALHAQTHALAYLVTARGTGPSSPPSPADIAAIRALLQDPHDDTVLTEDVTTLWHTARYSLREHAYDILRQWNVPVDRPVIDAPADAHQPVGRTLIAAVLLALAWPIGWLVARRGPSRPRFSAMLALWSAIVVAAIALGWAYTARHACSLVWARGDQRYQLIAHAGFLRLVRVDHQDDSIGIDPRPVGVVGAIFPRDADDMPLDLRALKPAQGWSHAGASFGQRNPPPPPAPFWASLMSNPPSVPRDAWIALVPWWWPTTLAALPALLFPSLGARRLMRRRHRRRAGHCPACGYDLRASPGRCPECGAAPV